MKDDHEQSGIFRNNLIDDLLAVAFHGQLRVKRDAEHRGEQEKCCTGH